MEPSKAAKTMVFEYIGNKLIVNSISGTPFKGLAVAKFSNIINRTY